MQDLARQGAHAENLDSRCNLDVDLSTISSPALARIINEIKNNDLSDTHSAYDRVHNRHNR